MFMMILQDDFISHRMQIDFIANYSKTYQAF